MATATPTATARRRHGPLLLAVALLAGAGALLSLGSGEPVRTTRPAPDFPSRMRAQEWERREERATWTPPAGAARPAVPVAADGDAGPPPERRDPLLVALPVKEDAPLVVFEANALRHSRLGEAFVRCMLRKDPDAFADLERETGIDPLKDLDRVAFAGDTLVLSGFFDRARWDRLEQEVGPPTAYGDAGRIYARRGEGPVVGVWRDQLMVLGDSTITIRQSLDQLEGRAPIPASGLPEDLAYGEVYGVLPGAAAKKLMPVADQELAARIAAAASRIELHVDAMDDVAAVVRVVGGEDTAGMQDLAKTLAGGLAAARIQAQVTNDRELADLLEFANVVDGRDTFSVELALPAERLEKWFGDCKPYDPPHAGEPDEPQIIDSEWRDREDATDDRPKE